LPKTCAAKPPPKAWTLGGWCSRLPYNGHTTAADILWAGVPFLTCRGTTWPGRVAASLLQAIGLPELVTQNVEDYESRAIALARDPGALAALKQKLAANRLTTPLFDTARWTRNAEAAFTEMWQRHRRGEAPQHFSV
jgi:predicted O-linked N-acetylglucosamine transferase (SPINDLY family)